MFTCDSCRKPTGPKVSPINVVVETRRKTYDYMRFDPENETHSPAQSVGWEIVREIKICKSCAITTGKLQ